MDRNKLSEHHNEAAPRIVSMIVKEVAALGGDDSANLILLESVVLGVLVSNEKLYKVTRRQTIGLLEHLTMQVEERLGVLKEGG